MRTETKNVTKEQARKTTFIVAAVLAMAAAFFYYRGRMNAVAVTVILAGLLLIAGAFLPPAAKAFHRGWMTFAFALGYVNSRIILTLVYFLVFVPYGVVSRLFGRDPLDLRSPPRDSYWHKREKTRQEREQFERLF